MNPSLRKIIPILLLLAGLAVIYFSFDWAIGAVIHQRRVIAVPDITGKTVPDALTILSQAQLSLSKEGEQYDKSHPAGMVIHQKPNPGMMVREGRVIRVILSQGGETLFVPDLVGQPIRNAQTALQNTGLNLGEVERRPSLRYDKDIVMTTDPAAGSQVAKSALVNVIVSEGAPEGDILLVPGFVGKPISAAKDWANAHQITVSVHEDNDVTKAQGEIITQAPPEDNPLRPGESLTLVVNQAPSSVVVLHIRYQVPESGVDRDIRIVLIDESGEHEVFRKSQAPGSSVDIPVTPKGHAKVRILANGIVVDQQDLP